MRVNRTQARTTLRTPGTGQTTIASDNPGVHYDKGEQIPNGAFMHTNDVVVEMR